MSNTRNEISIDDVTDAISTLGIGHKKASVLAYLLANKNVTQHEIERAIDLRQPEVSNYLREFSIKKWVGISETIKESKTKGRSSNVYNVIKEPAIIARELRDAYIDRNKISESVKLISKVRQLDT